MSVKALTQMEAVDGFKFDINMGLSPVF